MVPPPPRITSVNGDGSTDGITDSDGTHTDNHIESGLVVTGANFLSPNGAPVTAALTGIDGTLGDYSALTIRSDATDTRFAVGLPAALSTGKYLLTVTNQSGNAAGTLYVLQGENGANGNDGSPGAAGAVGAVGLKGDKGDTGTVSVTGSDMQILYINNGEAVGSEVYYNTTTAKLGIGTATPSARLTVQGKLNQVLSTIATLPGGTARVEFAGAETKVAVGDWLDVDGTRYTVTNITDGADHVLVDAPTAGWATTLTGITVKADDGNLFNINSAAINNAVTVNRFGNLSLKEELDAIPTIFEVYPATHNSSAPTGDIVVTLDTVNLDTRPGSFTLNADNTVTVKRAGYYDIEARILVDKGAAGWTFIMLYVDGAHAGYLSHSKCGYATLSWCEEWGIRKMYLHTGAILTMLTHQNVAQTLTWHSGNTNTDYTYLRITRMN